MCDALNCVAREHRVNATSDDPLGALFLQSLGNFGQRGGRIHHIIDDQYISAFDLADNIHDFSFRVARLRLVSPFIDDCEVRIESLRIGSGSLCATRIRSDDDQILERMLGKILNHHRGSVEMIDWNIKESLNLRCVQIDREHSIRAGGPDQVCHELRGDGDSRSVLLITARIAVVWNHRSDTFCGGSPACIEHDQELHEMRIDWRAGRLDDKDVAPAHIFKDLKVELAVGKGRCICPA